LLGHSEQIVKTHSDTPSDPGGDLVVVARKPPPPLPFPVTNEWRERVKEALKERGRGAQARLAEELGVSTGMLSEILKVDGPAKTSDLVEGIHKFLGWAPPLAPTATLDAGELLHGYERMTKAQRAFLDEARAVLEGESGDAARAALIAMLEAFRDREAEND
jgi:hypothetical protein